MNSTDVLKIAKWLGGDKCQPDADQGNQGPPGGGSGSLGIHARNVSLLRPDGSIVEHFAPDDLAKFTRLLRWQRQRGARLLLPDERVARCVWVRVKPMVETWKERKVKRAHYRGLVTCASVWMCPICAAKITERRRVELQETIDKARELGLMVWMVTITLQHTPKDKYKKLVDDLRAAWRRVRGGVGWQAIAARYQIQGIVTALEFTVSVENGGHPHLHALMFSKLNEKEFNSDEFKNIIACRYGNILKKNFKRYASAVYGVDVQVGDDKVGDYVAKLGTEKQEEKSTWTLSHEMTKGHMKSGLDVGQHYAPFQLIDLYLANKDKQARAMFIEYAYAFKGKRQITGLTPIRKKFGLSASMTDEVVAEMDEPDSYKFAAFTPGQWATIKRSGQRGLLLEVASDADYQTFRKYLLQMGIVLEWKGEDPK